MKPETRTTFIKWVYMPCSFLYNNYIIYIYIYTIKSLLKKVYAILTLKLGRVLRVWEDT